VRRDWNSEQALLAFLSETHETFVATPVTVPAFLVAGASVDESSPGPQEPVMERYAVRSGIRSATEYG